MNGAIEQIETIARAIQETHPAEACRLRHVAQDLQFPVKLARESLAKTTDFYAQPQDVQPSLFGRLRAAAQIFVERVAGRPEAEAIAS